jgi:serine protease AprX
VADVPDLQNRVIASVDLTPAHDGVDYFGHGTHMAGIIAGDGSSSDGQWTGVAPGANLVSIKVAGWDGATDVSEVIAGLQWVYANKSTYGIRVLNLSFGTDSTQSYSIDPLDFAVEKVWKKGVFVVVAAGNRGTTGPGSINKPADDPYVMTVGAADLRNTQDPSDDRVAPFSSRGPTQDGLTKPDVVAPGVTIVSDRAPGSTIDHFYPSARMADGYFKGTGTSQAAAVVSGVAALMFDANPNLTANQAKAIFMGTANQYIGGANSGAGTGLIRAAYAIRMAAWYPYAFGKANQGLTASTGTGSLEASRGSFHVYADLDGDGVPELVQGEVDVLGNAWDAASWAANSWSAVSWNAVSWNAASWNGCSWDAASWDAASWDAVAWDAASWDAASWAGSSWA